MISLGSTGIVTPQCGFGALPIQRISDEAAGKLLLLAYESGVTFFDTARAYTDSEHKIGLALAPVRDRIYLASKTGAKDPEGFWKDLKTSLENLKTDYLDIYQFHCADRCYRPGDGSGMYEAMLEAKKKGWIRHIGITAHKISVAEEAAVSGLYETLQYPFSYLASERELELVKTCREHHVGFIAMKGLCGGLLNHSAACAAFMAQFDNVVPIWGVQRESELREFLSYLEKTPSPEEPELAAIIEKDRKELTGDFCRSCGYCMPCSVGINIPQCARMAQLLRRMPPAQWLTEEWQREMEKISACIRCGKCMKKCPYGLKIPDLLRKNLEDYKTFVKK